MLLYKSTIKIQTVIRRTYHESTYSETHREFIINFPDSIDQNKANEGWAKLQQIVEDYKKAHNGASVYAPTFIEDCEAEVKKLQEEYGFEYTVEYVQ